MKETIARLKWFLIIPFFGSTIDLLILRIMRKKDSLISLKQLFLYALLSYLTFLAGAVIFVLILGLINKIVPVPYFLKKYCVIFALIFGGYLENIVCFLYLRKLEKAEEKSNMNDFEWSEFYYRFAINYEEFLFYYKDKRIDISTGGYKGGVYLSYGNEEKGFILRDYTSPKEFLKDKLFDGKTLFEVWDNLE